MCSGLPKKDIAQQCRLAEGIVHTIMSSIYEKVDISNRLELVMWVRDALNDELRRRKGE